MRTVATVTRLCYLASAAIARAEGTIPVREGGGEGGSEGEWGGGRGREREGRREREEAANRSHD